MPSNRLANAFGTWDFISLKGHPDLPGMQVEPITKRGVGGVAFLEEAFRAEPTPIYLHGLVETLPQLAVALSDMKNLQGTQVSLYDSSGQLYNGVVITNVRHIRNKFVLKPSWLNVSYASGWRFTHSMIVHYPYTSF